MGIAFTRIALIWMVDQVSAGGILGRRADHALTEVQLLSFVCSTGGKGSKPRLWNIQNLGPVPPYTYNLGLPDCLLSRTRRIPLSCGAGLAPMAPPCCARGGGGRALAWEFIPLHQDNRFLGILKQTHHVSIIRYKLKEKEINKENTCMVAYPFQVIYARVSLTSGARRISL